VPKRKHSAKKLFVECQKNTRQRHFCRVPKENTWQRSSLLSVKKTLDKDIFCRVPKRKHLAMKLYAKCFLLPSVLCLAHDNEFLCRVTEKALDKLLGIRQRLVFW
jgi:hypothetical protein